MATQVRTHSRVTRGKKQLGTFPNCNTSFEIGKCYLLRTVTYFYTGRITSITDTDIVLEDAAWIADTGRFHDALKTGIFHEVEPFVDHVIVLRGTIVDATVWKFDLPRVQK